jgi:hypothetical protein
MWPHQPPSIPDYVPDEKALYLDDVLCTSYHCPFDAAVKEGDVVLFWASAPLGSARLIVACVQLLEEYELVRGGQTLVEVVVLFLSSRNHGE